MNTTKSITMSLAIVACSVVSTMVSAQPPATKPIVKQSVSPRALITQVEIAEYRRAIKAAPNHEKKMAIREATYTKLRQRAVERGMVMSEPQPWFGGLHWGEVVPSQSQQKNAVKPKLTVPETKLVVPSQVAHPQAKPATPHQARPVLTRQVLPLVLPHPMKPVLR